MGNVASSIIQGAKCQTIWAPATTLNHSHSISLPPVHFHDTAILNHGNRFWCLSCIIYVARAVAKSTSNKKNIIGVSKITALPLNPKAVPWHKVPPHSGCVDRLVKLVAILMTQFHRSQRWQSFDSAASVKTEERHKSQTCSHFFFSCTGGQRGG